MSGTDKLLADSNTLIYLDQGNHKVAALLAGKSICISFITEIELLGYPMLSRQKLAQLKEMISGMQVIEMNNLQKQITIELKQKRKLRTPDAIIAAAAIEKGVPLLTADKAFSKIPELQCVLLEL